MRIHLLTALVLAVVPTAMYAQDAIPDRTSQAPVAATISRDDQAAPPPEDPTAAYNPRMQEYQVLQNVFATLDTFAQDSGGAAEAAGPLIVFDQHEPKALDEMAEDLNIFSFIVKRNLEKALGEQMPEIKMGVPMLLESGGRHIHASYIEGFGALFNLRVAVPIVAPPASEAKSEVPKEPSEWEKARAALYGGGAAVQPDWSRVSMRAVQHYDPKVVETLKNQVLESLKSAGNLRGVKPDEWIVVTITGAPNGPDTQPGAAGVAGTGTYGGGLVGSRTWSPSGRPTVMTFRVKKSTVEALTAKGGSEEQFAGKVEVTAYLGAEVASRGGGGMGVVFSSGSGGGQNFFHAVPQP